MGGGTLAAVVMVVVVGESGLEGVCCLPLPQGEDWLVGMMRPGAGAVLDDLEIWVLRGQVKDVVKVFAGGCGRGFFPK